MYQAIREKKRLACNIKSRARFSFLSLLLAAVFVTSLFLVPTFSFAQSSNDAVPSNLDGVTWNAEYTVCTLSPTISGAPVNGDSLRLEIYQHQDTIEKFETQSDSAITGNVSDLFQGYTKLNTADFSNLGQSTITGMRSMFSFCSALSSLNLPATFDTSSVTDMSSAFADCSALSDFSFLSNLKTSNVTDMSNMFLGVSSLSLPANFDTSSVTDMSNMFAGVSSLSLPATFNTSSVTDMSGMFEDCSITDFSFLSYFNTQNVTVMSYMFAGVTSLSLPATFNTSNVTNMTQMFEDCSITDFSFLSHFNTQNVTDMDCMFGGCSNVASLDLSTFNFEKVDRASLMFANCDALEELNLGEFIPPKGGFDFDANVGLFASYVGEDNHPFITGSIQNIKKITMDGACILEPGEGTGSLADVSGTYFDYKAPKSWNAYQNGVLQATLTGFDEFKAYQQTHLGATTYVLNDEPTPPDPGPDPTPTDTVTLTFRTDEGSWNGTTETTLTGAPDAAIIAPVYPTVDATRTCIGWFDEAGKQIISGQTKFSEVIGTVTARFVDTPGWHQNATGWWYVYDLNNNYYTNCWALINSAWFYFNDAGYCLEYTWGYIGGNWYFFGWGGYMQTGWQWLGGSWYFLDRNSGAMHTGWVHDGVWYYCDAALGGAMYDNCWAYINGEWYGFNEGGSMTQGWSWSYVYDGWFYLEPETGHMLYGWQYIGGHWYYFYDNGLMAANTYVGTYWLGSDGAMW